MRTSLSSYHAEWRSCTSFFTQKRTVLRFRRADGSALRTARPQPFCQVLEVPHPSSADEIQGVLLEDPN